MKQFFKELLCKLIGHNEEYRLDTENLPINVTNFKIVPDLHLYCKRCNKHLKTFNYD